MHKRTREKAGWGSPNSRSNAFVCSECEKVLKYIEARPLIKNDWALGKCWDCMLILINEHRKERGLTPLTKYTSKLGIVRHQDLHYEVLDMYRIKRKEIEEDSWKLPE